MWQYSVRFEVHLVYVESWFGVIVKWYILAWPGMKFTVCGQEWNSHFINFHTMSDQDNNYQQDSSQYWKCLVFTKCCNIWENVCVQLLLRSVIKRLTSLSYFGCIVSWLTYSEFLYSFWSVIYMDNCILGKPIFICSWRLCNATRSS